MWICSPRSFRHSSFPWKSRHNRPADPRLATTRSPSVAQVAEPNGLVSWVGSLPAESTYVAHFSLPVLRSMHRTPRLAPFWVAWVRKTWSPQTAGEAFPRSGSGAFQRTFSVAPQVSGGSVVADWPMPVGPRQPGQFSAPAAVDKTRRVRNERDVFIGNP